MPTAKGLRHPDQLHSTGIPGQAVLPTLHPGHLLMTKGKSSLVLEPKKSKTYGIKFDLLNLPFNLKSNYVFTLWFKLMEKVNK